MRIVYRWGVCHRRSVSTALTLTTRLRAAPLSHDMFTLDHKLLCVCVFFLFVRESVCLIQLGLVGQGMGRPSPRTAAVWAQRRS